MSRFKSSAVHVIVCGLCDKMIIPVSDTIFIDKDIINGKPRIIGTRIGVSLILNLLANGMSIDDIISEYHQLTREQIVAAITFASNLTDQNFTENLIPK